MLEKLLTEIRQGGTLDARTLAARLDTSPQMVEAMLEHLRRSGFLRAYETCAEACDGCGLREGCDTQKKNASIHLWQYIQEEK